MKTFTAATIAALFTLGAAAPAAAQDEAGDRVNMVIAYSENECPDESAPNEIVVCTIVVEGERYRIPTPLRHSDDPENTSWAQRVEGLKFVGDFGAMSCSPTGAAGFTGCTQKMIDAAYEARESGATARFGQLIAEARAERLSTIDADAAAQQERVEMIEREYMERLERERAAEVPADPLPEPSSSDD